MSATDEAPGCCGAGGQDVCGGAAPEKSQVSHDAAMLGGHVTWDATPHEEQLARFGASVLLGCQGGELGRWSAISAETVGMLADLSGLGVSSMFPALGSPSAGALDSARKVKARRIADQPQADDGQRDTAVSGDVAVSVRYTIQVGGRSLDITGDDAEKLLAHLSALRPGHSGEQGQRVYIYPPAVSPPPPWYFTPGDVYCGYVQPSALLTTGACPDAGAATGTCAVTGLAEPGGEP